MVEESISICTNGLKTNAGSDMANVVCVGKMLN
jgi:hypothetical protein